MAPLRSTEDQPGAAGGGGSGGVQDEIRKLREEYVSAGGRDPSMLEAPPLQRIYVRVHIYIYIYIHVYTYMFGAGLSQRLPPAGPAPVAVPTV